jgi:membrane protein insertase Oxa1/YidC/SpoIIIJ
MPWFLMFIMAPFAAGLQLYWVVSNLISIAQQKWLYSRHPILKEQMAAKVAGYRLTIRDQYADPSPIRNLPSFTI